MSEEEFEALMDVIQALIEAKNNSWVDSEKTYTKLKQDFIDTFIFRD